MCYTKVIHNKIKQFVIIKGVFMMSEELQVNENQEKTDIDVSKALADAIENDRLKDEEEQEVKDCNGIRYHESHTDRRTVHSILKRFAEHNIVIPDCQRLYIWRQKNRDSLMDSVRKGLLCGSITLCTLEGGDDTQYLIDGLQRITSLLILTNDESLSEEDKTKVNNYQVSMEIVYNMTLEEMADYFVKKNSGIAVSAATKNNASLPSNIRAIGMKLSRNEFFQNIAEKANTTFSKNEHNKVIAWNALLACAGVEVDSIKSADITKRLVAYESDVMNHTEEAEILIERLSKIYALLTDDKFIKRSMNANFVSILVYVMHNNPDISNEQIAHCIETIFAKGKAIPQYSATTGGYGACKENCKKRYSIIVDLLNNSESDEQTDDEAFKTFCKKNNNRVFNTNDEEHPVCFADMTDKEQELVYKFRQVNPNVNQYEGVLIKAFLRISKADEKESA